MVRSSPTTRAPRFGESFASLDTPSAPSAPLTTFAAVDHKRPARLFDVGPRFVRDQLVHFVGAVALPSSRFPCRLWSTGIVPPTGFNIAASMTAPRCAHLVMLGGARSRLVKIGKSNQFRLGVVNHSLRSSRSRPSVLVENRKPSLTPREAFPFG